MAVYRARPGRHVCFQREARETHLFLERCEGYMSVSREKSGRYVCFWREFRESCLIPGRHMSVSRKKKSVRHVFYKSEVSDIYMFLERSQGHICF